MKIILVITTLTPTKKTKEHNDYLMKPDDTQRHEEGSPITIRRNYLNGTKAYHK